jgi:hypothetical protein
MAGWRAGIGVDTIPIAYAGSTLVLLALGWAEGVTLGHLPKLLFLSIWVWWPPGPRPRQDALYPPRLAQLEAAILVAGVEVCDRRLPRQQPDRPQRRDAHGSSRTANRGDGRGRLGAKEPEHPHQT